MVAKIERRNGRVRALRSMLLLALGLVLLGAFGAGAQAAELPTVTGRCSTPSPIQIDTPVNCVGFAQSADGVSPAPTGQLHFFSFAFLEIPQTSCTLLPFPGDPTRSFCVEQVIPRIGGITQSFQIAYQDLTTLDFTTGTVNVPTTEGHVSVTCDPDDSEPVVGDRLPCQAFVPDTAGIAGHPTGVVHLKSIEGAGEFRDMNGALSTNECTLVPADGGSTCDFTWEAELESELAIVAHYDGDGTHPADTGSKLVQAIESHETLTVLTCDNRRPVAGTTVMCTATVTNNASTGGAPKGTVEFHAPFGTVFPSSQFCDVSPISARVSACTRPIRFMPGDQTLTVQYKGHDDPGGLDPVSWSGSNDFLELIVSSS